MKTQLCCILGAIVSFGILHPSPSPAQGVAFTYQGRLNDGGNPANGTYDLQFTLYNSTNLPGVVVAGPITNFATIISNGLFTANVDFETNVFTGENRWLEIGVGTNGASTFTTVSPRQKITPAPYAITASYLANVVANNTVSAPNFATVGGGYGNAGLGYDSTIGGGAGNTALGFYATIAGGGLNYTANTGATVGGGYSNTNNAYMGTIAGGQMNFATADNSTIAGGNQNTIQSNALNSTISGGSLNTIQAGSTNSVIGGGLQSLIYGSYATIAGGRFNGAALFAAVGGGELNNASGNNSYIGGGDLNSCSGILATIGAGQFNISSNAFSTVAGGRQNIAGGINATVAGGIANSSLGNYSMAGGGYQNVLGYTADYSFIGGGRENQIVGSLVQSAFSTIGGGDNNMILTNAFDSTISGGSSNTILNGASISVIGGGAANMLGGVITNTTIVGTTVAGGVGNRADCAYSVISGGKNNLINDFLFTVFGTSLTTSPYSVIAGGELNNVGTSGLAPSYPADHSTVGGGFQNSVWSAAQSVIAGGGNNRIYFGDWSAIPGGQNNEADGYWSFAAGQRAKAYNQGTFVWADSQPADFASTASDQFLIRAQGGVGINKNNPASTLDVNGTARIQGGNYWDVDHTEGDFRVGNDSFRFKIGVANSGGGSGDVWMRADGGTARMFLKTPGGTTIYSNEGQTAGVALGAGGGSWANLSDRNSKENFAAVDAREILQRVAALPLTTWNYKSQEKTIRHIGPMAQDFASAFKVGEDERHITTIDSEGVALAAIQGLNEKMESENAALRAENTDLKTRLERLEQLVNSKDD